MIKDEVISIYNLDKDTYIHGDEEDIFRLWEDLVLKDLEKHRPDLPSRDQYKTSKVRLLKVLNELRYGSA